MQCEACGRDVPAEAVFCPNCGSELPASSDAADGEPDSASGTSASGAERFREATGRRSPTNHAAESELWTGSYSPKAMFGWAIAAAFLTIVGMVAASLAGPPGWIALAIAAALVWAGLGLVLQYRRMTVHYRLTNYRFFHETGLLSRTRNRIEVIDINDVTLRSGLIERMVNVGTIHIQSSDVTHPDLDLPGIDNVKYVADLIDDTRRAERQRRGVFMENIGAGPGPG